MAELRIEGLTKRFDGNSILDGIDLQVESGALLAILGASGGGKTTLLRLIAGFERPDAGMIKIEGVVVESPRTHTLPEQRRIGYLTQEGALFPHLTVEQNIGFGLQKRADRAARITRMMELVGLPALYARRFPHQLSGGEQQRTALARALAPEPRLVLLDEPFSAIDAALRREIRRSVLEVLKAVGATAVLVTHDQDEALSMGDRVAVLRGGRIAQHDRPASLYRNPVDLAMGQFVGESVLLDGEAHGGRIHCPLGVLTSTQRIDGPVQVLLRPEQIRLVAHATPGSVAADISGIQYFGSDVLVELRLADATPIAARMFSHELPQIQGRVGVMIVGAVCAFPSSKPAVRLVQQLAG